MTLEAKLKIIQEKLKDNRNFPNESSISQGIVLPILRELNWDTDDTRVVRPERPVGKNKVDSGRTDFALCDDSDNPKVFIEVKKLGGLRGEAAKTKAEKQILEYAFIAVGRPESPPPRIVVLTDGVTWSFYLLAKAEGGRRFGIELVLELDVLEQSPQESSEILQRYLEKSRVVLGEAIETARVFLFLEKYSEDEPAMWGKMVDEAITNLVRASNFLAGEIKSKSAQDNIVDYFHSLLREKISPSPSGITAQGRQASAPPMPPAPMLKTSAGMQPESGGQVPAPPSSGASGGGSGKIGILGKSFPCKNPTDAMVIVFKELERREPGFLQRFYEDGRNYGKTRRIIAQDVRGLYETANPLYENAYKQLGGDWIIATYNNKRRIERNIRIAAEMAGLEFGKDIIITLNNGGSSKSQSPLQNPDTVFQVGSVSRKLQTGGIRQQVFNLINEGKEVTLGTIINTIPKDKAVAALRNLVKRQIVAIK